MLFVYHLEKYFSSLAPSLFFKTSVIAMSKFLVFKYRNTVLAHCILDKNVGWSFPSWKFIYNNIENKNALCICQGYHFIASLEWLVVKKTVSQHHSERGNWCLAQEGKSMEHSRKTVSNRRQQELQNSNIYQNLWGQQAQLFTWPFTSACVSKKTNILVPFLKLQLYNEHRCSTEHKHTLPTY